jgi:hypothetical protein
MFMTTGKIVTAVSLTLGFLALGNGLLDYTAAVQPPTRESGDNQAHEALKTAEDKVKEAKKVLEAAEAQFKKAQAAYESAGKAARAAKAASLRQQLQLLDWILESVHASTLSIAITSPTREHAARSSLSLEGLVVANDATILIDGNKGKFGDLKQGMKLSLQFAADQDMIAKVQATSERQVDYVLKGMDLKKSTVSLTTLTVGGQTFSLEGLPVADNAEISIEGQRHKLTDLKAGMHVSLLMTTENGQLEAHHIWARK